MPDAGTTRVCPMAALCMREGSPNNMRKVFMRMPTYLLLVASGCLLLPSLVFGAGGVLGAACAGRRLRWRFCLHRLLIPVSFHSISCDRLPAAQAATADFVGGNSPMLASSSTVSLHLKLCQPKDSRL